MMKVEVLDPNINYGPTGRGGTVLASLNELEKQFGPNEFTPVDNKVSHQYTIKIGSKILEIWAYRYDPTANGSDMRTAWSIGEVNKGAIGDLKKEVPELNIFHGTELSKIQETYGFGIRGLVRYLNNNKKIK
jgi:hypothetical protein